MLPMDKPTLGQEDLPTRLVQLIDELPQNRNSTKSRIDQQQMKQKEYHDQRITKTIEYQIGDKVLLYRAEKEKHYSGKFDEKWKGPYYIHDIIRKDVYRLRTIDGKLLTTPINTVLLKPYYDRQNWTPSITITDQQ